jgi:hypothetical protein
MVRDERYRFQQVIIVFMEANQPPSYQKFIEKSMKNDGVVFVNCGNYGASDWRHVSIHHALPYSKAPYIWFTEQDFAPEPGFWDFVRQSPKTDVLGVYQGDRLHPCSLFIRRDVFERTSKNFAVGPGYDHFGAIQYDLTANGANILEIPRDLYFHYNGMSSNWSLVSRGELPNYEPDRFYTYLLACLKSGMELAPKWKKTAIGALKRYRPIVVENAVIGRGVPYPPLPKKYFGVQA